MHLLMILPDLIYFAVEIDLITNDVSNPSGKVTQTSHILQILVSRHVRSPFILVAEGGRLYN